MNLKKKIDGNKILFKENEIKNISNIENNNSSINNSKKKKSKTRNKNLEEISKNNLYNIHNKNLSKINQRNKPNIKTVDTGTLNSASTLKETLLTLEDKNSFDFNQSLWNIFFLKKMINEKGQIVDIYEGDIFNKRLRMNIMKQKIKLIYNLLITHRKHLEEKILLKEGKTYFFENLDYFRNKFIEIEKYIFNYIFLIKFLINLGDPVSLINANQTLNHISKELLDLHPKKGLLVYSINFILKKCMNQLKARKFYRKIDIPYEVVKKYLLIISIFLKFSELLQMPKLYKKFLDHYAHIFDVALYLVTQQHHPEKILLKSNLLFNIGCYFVKKNLLKFGNEIYRRVINIQENLEVQNFIYVASYYNCSILFYVMGDMNNSELYLGNILNKIGQKHIDMHKYSKDLKKSLLNLSNLECKLLIFNAEYNMEKENYLKAIESLKQVIKILSKDGRRDKKTIGEKEDKNNKKRFNLFKKEKTDTQKKYMKGDKEIVPYEFLLENEYYNSLYEKKMFNEQIKKIVNGLFDAILFLQKDKEEILKEKNKISNNEESDESVNKIKRNISDNALKKYKENSNFNDGNIDNKKERNKTYEKENDFKTLNRKKKLRRSETIITKENHMKNFLQKKQNKQIEKNENDDKKIEEGKNHIFINEKKSKKILNYFRDDLIQKIKLINNEEDISDFKYFFILLANLSLKQLEILNSTQNYNAPKELYYNLPIFFSSQFKNSLNPGQKNIFDKLKFLSLIRCKVLDNPSKKISIENINFKIFYLNRININMKLKNFTDIKNKIKEIMSRKSSVNSRYYKYKYFLSLNNEGNNYIEEKKVEFRYNKEFNLEKFRKELLNEIHISYMIYSQDEIDDMELVVKSDLFVNIMNGLDLKDIKEFKNNKPIFMEILNNEIKRIKNADIDSDFSNSTYKCQ